MVLIVKTRKQGYYKIAAMYSMYRIVFFFCTEEYCINICNLEENVILFTYRKINVAMSSVPAIQETCVFQIALVMMV